MNQKNQKAYDDVVEKLNEVSHQHKMSPPDYFELLEYLASHLETCMDCYREEHKDDFE